MAEVKEHGTLNAVKTEEWSSIDLNASGSKDSSRSTLRAESSNAGTTSRFPENSCSESTIKVNATMSGTGRPGVFTSTWAEAHFVFSICMCQVLTDYFISGFNVLVPVVVEKLHVAPPNTIWPASVYSLVVASFLLPFGRLADMRGGMPVYLIGLCWLMLWSVVAGFVQNEVMLNLCRALQGLGSAAYLPSSIMLLSKIYRPGPRKNFVFSVYGACVPVGFYLGIFVAGLTSEYGQWRWFFWIGAILTLLTLSAAAATVKSDVGEQRALGVKMDWAGTFLLVTGLMLTTFAITAVSHAPERWRTPYVYITLTLGGLCLGGATYVEGWIAAEPLLPPDLFSTANMSPLIIAIMLDIGAEAAWLLYGTLFMQDMGATPLQIAAWYSPYAIGGLILGITGGLIMHIVSNTALLIFSACCWLVPPVLLALAPLDGSYWAWIFPGTIAATLAMDIMLNIANVYMTNVLPLRRQGLAGAVINSALRLGCSFFLGCADIVETSSSSQTKARHPYQAAFWFQLACASAALVLFVAFIRIKPAKGDLTADEKRDDSTTAEVIGMTDSARSSTV